MPSAGVQSDAKFAWLGQSSLEAAAAAGVDGDNRSSFVRSGTLSTTDRNEFGRTSSPAVDAAMASDPGRLGKQGTDRSLLPPTPVREQRSRVAIALDRMGAAVIEVREAFQRWVPQTRRPHDVGPKHVGTERQGRKTRAKDEPGGVAKSLVGHGKREVHHSDSAKRVTPEAAVDVADLKGGVMRAMMELRLPVETAEYFCNKTDGVDEAPAGEISFADFVALYADAAGLLTESAHDRKGGEVWVEGPGGRWTAVSRKESEGARRVFFEKATEQEQETKSDDTSDAGGKAALVICTRARDPTHDYCFQGDVFHDPRSVAGLHVERKELRWTRLPTNGQKHNIC